MNLLWSSWFHVVITVLISYKLYELLKMDVKKLVNKNGNKIRRIEGR